MDKKRQADRICKVTDCNAPTCGQGYCGKHYARWKAHGDPLVSKYARSEPTPEWILEKFMSLVRKTENCWIWIGTVTHSGYGQFKIPGPRNRKVMRAHRFSYELFRGKIPAYIPGTVELDHLCRNRLCVRPDHLELVPQRVNTVRSSISIKLFCINGHKFTLENTRIYKGQRKCRACARSLYRRRAGWKDFRNPEIIRPVKRGKTAMLETLPDFERRITK